MRKYTVLVADGQTLIRESWTLFLNVQPQFTVVAESSTGEETLELCRRHLPDIVLTEVNLPDMDGIALTRGINEACPTTRVIGVSAHNKPGYAREMLGSGAMAYVSKGSPAKELFTALNRALSGRKYVCQEIKKKIAEQVMVEGDSLLAVQTLTPREKGIIQLIKAGMFSSQIAEQLSLSHKTVELYRSKILRKLNLPNAAALVNFVNHHVLF